MHCVSTSVDVFAERPYAGNPLAVVVGADYLSDETSAADCCGNELFGNDVRGSAPEHDQGYRVRIFTPAQEIASPGTQSLERRGLCAITVMQGASVPVRLQPRGGAGPRHFRVYRWWKRSGVVSRTSGHTWATCAAERIAAALGVSPEDIETKAPVQQLSAGLSAIVVPLRSLKVLDKSSLIMRHSRLWPRRIPALIYLFCSETSSPRERPMCEFFFDALGWPKTRPREWSGISRRITSWRHRLPFPIRSVLAIGARIRIRRPSLVMLRARMIGRSREVNVVSGYSDSAGRTALIQRSTSSNNGMTIYRTCAPPHPRFEQYRRVCIHAILTQGFHFKTGTPYICKILTRLLFIKRCPGVAVLHCGKITDTSKLAMVRARQTRRSPSTAYTDIETADSAIWNRCGNTE